MLSKKTQYALQALSYMVEKHTDDPILIAEIARQKNIPIKFLENILLSLRKAGFLESKKGKHGGYFFAQAPEKIKLSKLIAGLSMNCFAIDFKGSLESGIFL